MPSVEQIDQLETAIANLEGQRTLLGDALIDQALAPLYAQLAELKTAVSPPIAHASTFEGERRQVTILFADVSGFTALSEITDPEEIRALMNACFDALVPSIEKFGGRVNKFIGDEIMALFGAPVANENDPERALRAALEMSERLEDFNNRQGTQLGLHFGINSGPVIAGSIGTQDQQQYDVMGDAVNLAARLAEASERGEIFVGPNTHRLTTKLFVYETLEPIRVKGKRDLVQVYRLITTRERSVSVRGLAGLESAMVGRDAEVASLLAVTEKLRSNRGGIAAITGEPGLGKTRLIEEWKSILVGQPFKVVEGRSLSYGQSMAYHMLVDLLHSLLGVTTSTEPLIILATLRNFVDDLFPEAQMEVYPYLAHLLSLPIKGEALELVRDFDPLALKAQYQRMLRRLFKRLTSRVPMIVILEDIHWADPSSTDLLVKLLPLIIDNALLFCGTTRPEKDMPGWTWVDTGRELYGSNLLEINLRPLTNTESSQLFSNLLEFEELPINIHSAFLEKTEGNPLFVEEVIRMLIDQGAIVQQDQKWVAVKEIDDIEIPDNLQSLLLARIDRLPEEAKYVLRIASVIGRQFSVKVLEQVI